MTYFLIFGIISAVVFFFSLKSATAKARIFLTIAAAIIFGCIGWWAMPTLAYGFYGLPLMITIIGVVAGILSFITDDDFDDSVSKVAISTTIIGVLFWLIVPLITSWSAFHASAYHQLLGKMEETEFSSTVSPIDIHQVRTVDHDYAQLLAGKRLGEIPEVISRVEMGDLQIQMLTVDVTIVDHNGKESHLETKNGLWWVGPLNHSGFFKWWNNANTPGFVMVSATDANQVHLVTQFKTIGSSVNSANQTAATSQPLELRYFLDGAYFSNDLERYLRSNGYSAKGLSDYSFELRDGDLRPFWVVTVYKNTIGYEGSDATSVVIVDAQTGEIKEYTIAETPAWVDRIQPSGFVETQINDWGKFGDGWWNSWTSQNNVQHVTPGSSLVPGNDGKSYWYVGMQSAKGHENGTVGFVLVNTKTKKAHRYLMAGITETDAKAALQNAKGIKEAGYTSTKPILYNVGGTPTFFAALKGNDGRPKMYGFVDRQSGNVVGVAKTPDLALRNYQTQLHQGSTANVENLVSKKTIKAKVVDVVREIVGDYVFTYLRLEGYDGKEFYGNSEVSLELKWTKIGDEVTVLVDEGESSSLIITGFDNLNLHLKDLK